MTLTRREFLVRSAVAASLAAMPRRPAWAATDGFLVIEDVEPGAQPWLAYKVAPAPAVVAEGHTAE